MVANIEKLLDESSVLIIKKAMGYNPKLKPISEGRGFVEFINIGKKTNTDIIKAAYMNAASCFDEKRGIAKSIGVELLLFLASTDQIGAAIKTLSPKTGEDFLIISNSKKLYEKTAKNLKVSNFDSKHLGKQELEKELERMALSRL
jgi:tRNA threonylcarbamoyladenosine modification (KEOPS) complex Cgi121 subunit